MKLGIFGYCPPPHFPGANAFIENVVVKHKTAYDLFLYSDHRNYGFHHCLPPDHFKSQNPRCGISNALFILAIRYAVFRKYTHILYLEADCRVGIDRWDEIMFNEFFSFKFPKIAAGSLVAHSCTNGGFKFYQRFWQEMKVWNQKQHVVPVYGIPVSAGFGREFDPSAGNVVGPGDARLKYKPSIYPNGALGIYDVAWMCEFFGIKPDGTFKEGFNMVNHVQNSAWDHMIGTHIYDRFSIDAFEMVGHMDSCFSSYGDSVSTEDERLQALRDNKATAIHQVKSEKQP